MQRKYRLKDQSKQDIKSGKAYDVYRIPIHFCEQDYSVPTLKAIVSHYEGKIKIASNAKDLCNNISEFINRNPQAQIANPIIDNLASQIENLKYEIQELKKDKENVHEEFKKLKEEKNDSKDANEIKNSLLEIKNRIIQMQDLQHVSKEEVLNSMVAIKELKNEHKSMDSLEMQLYSVNNNVVTLNKMIQEQQGIIQEFQQAKDQDRKMMERMKINLQKIEQDLLDSIKFQKLLETKFDEYLEEEEQNFNDVRNKYLQYPNK